MAFVLAVPLAASSGAAPRARQPAEPVLTFESLLKEISSAPPNPCNFPAKDYSDIEDHLFSEAGKAVVQQLDGADHTSLSGAATASGMASGSPDQAGTGPRVLALKVLENLEHLSAEINKSWPDENRFHFAVLDLPPALVVKMSFRNRATFAFLAVPQQDADGRETKLWQDVGALDDHRYERDQGWVDLTLFPLQRGPFRRARFLAKFGVGGCAGSSSVQYYAYEWHPEGTGGLDEVIKLAGAVSQEEPISTGQPSGKGLSSSFPPIGELRTAGSVITLPYCWFSSIDTWDNPSLCAVDSYDLSGDRVQFVGRETNRPDLVPVANAVQYAQTHDLPAVLAYCGSPEVARQMVREIPPEVVAAAGLTVTRLGPAKERVELGETFQFDVEKRTDRWLVVAFRYPSTSK